jgi:cell division protein FtsI (penicillin-binding protein 3)
MTEPRKKSNPGRMFAVMVVILLWCATIGVRLVLLQVVYHDDYVQQAQQQQQATRPVLAPRGIVYDARFDELATSVSVSTVHAEPRLIGDDKAKEKAARSLSEILGEDFHKLYSRMTDPARQSFMVVKRRIDPKDEALIENLKIKGVYLVEESMRVYPNRDLACQILGFVNMNGDGGAGVEMQYDQELKGIEGQISYEVDALKQPFRGKIEKAPQQGHSLVLTVDKSIQYIAERELSIGVENAGAAQGTAIVMESDTGRILALASYPGYNCNAYNDYSPDFWKNRAVSDYFEPGSTFKVVVAAAALEAGLTRPEEPIDCQMGSITVGKHIFHDHKPYGVLTFNEILEYSSNVGAAKLGLRLGEQGLFDALHRFGFGAKTGIDLPGEIIGMVRDLKRWSGLSVAAISFGQEVGVTSIQILNAINAVANGGNLVQPYVVDMVIDHNGDLVRINKKDSTRIMRPETAAAVRDAFEGVVLRGTGKKAALEGYRAAGKTGTAQKIVDGRYSNTKYVASFIGFAPLPRPRITVLVQVDEPRGGIYGGDISAPIFRAIAQEALLQLRVPPDRTLPVKSPRIDIAPAQDAEDFRPNATPVLPVTAQPAIAEGAPQEDVITVRVTEANVVVPDFLGMSKRAALELCQELGLKLQMSGLGKAVFQLPPAGTLVPPGELCTLTFANGKPAPATKAPVAGKPAQGGKPGAAPGSPVAALRHTDPVKR